MSRNRLGRLKGNTQATNFWESATKNVDYFTFYYNRLLELSTSMFEWKNLPPTIDPRYLELALFTDGRAVFFKDDGLDDYLALRCTIGGDWNVYNIPKTRRAYATNGYSNNSLNEDNSVIIYNNMIHSGSQQVCEIYATKLAELDRTIDVNINAQKTPVLIQGNENQRLTLHNLYMKYEGNEPVIFGDNNLNVEGIKVLRTDAPFIADKLYEQKSQIWNEALTYLGISNVNALKRERMIVDEVTRNLGGTIASRYSRLDMRREACKQINALFGLDIWCDYKEDYQMINNEANDTTQGEELKGEPNQDVDSGGEVVE